MSKSKIAVFDQRALTPDQKRRFEELGEVTFHGFNPDITGDEYYELVKDVDIIASTKAGLRDAYPKLHDVFVTIPFVSAAFLDLELLRRNDVTVANAPGANRHAVAEWAMTMTLLLMRNLWGQINADGIELERGLPVLTRSLFDSKMTVLGAGNVGRRVAELATAFGMKVTIFHRGDNLFDAVRDADVVVNALPLNNSTRGILNQKFFGQMKRGSYFVSVGCEAIIDDTALVSALDSNHLHGAAVDPASINVGDTHDPVYQSLKDHSKILATPHIAYAAGKSIEHGTDIMIDNIKAWLDGKPQNIIN
ncbi:NAD-binding protein [Candidatus Saccharibacteria bacterium]|nr:NAD-binding protein [Candidatus Saccharibacteria bacterium]MCL1962805.1 NAD-binding protein [Candidatus Saccharibacteria bacterium]